MQAKTEILIAEDSRSQAANLEKILRNHGYATRTAVDGRQALEATRRHPPALIISDVMMPVMDGFQFCRAVKQEPGLCDIPVILLTSLKAPADLLSTLEAGADLHIPKPFQGDYLLGKIVELLARDSNSRRVEHQCAETLTFDGTTYQISATREQMLRLLLSTYEVAIQQNQELHKTRMRLQALNESLEEKVLDRTANLLSEIAKGQQGQRELEASNATLSRRNIELQNFYHTVSHELKTPLTSAREFTSILLDGITGPITDDQEQYLQFVLESCDRIQFCITDMLEAALLDKGKLDVFWVDTPIATLVANVVGSMAPAMQAKGIDFRCEIDPALVSVLLASARINQVCMSLLNNALKFTPAGGVVTLRVGNDPDQPELLRFSVSDTGCGIAPEHLDRIFDKLYQVRETEVSTAGGLGLGLYIANGIVRLHGGRMWVESTPGHASTFHFTVPRHVPSP